MYVPALYPRWYNASPLIRTRCSREPERGLVLLSRVSYLSCLTFLLLTVHVVACLHLYVRVLGLGLG